ncbi:MAG: protein kinase [Planctomycetales bacterium]|nr:protein kinase [Planctomycetales bacterium]
MTEAEDGNDPEFDRIVHEYYESVERGDDVRPQDFLRRHPEYADELQSFFAGLQFLGPSPVLPGTIGIEQPQSSEDSSEAMPPGTSVRYIGDYLIISEIARGGMGVVYKARQEKLGRIVALKMMLAGTKASPAIVDRFHREARSAAALRHPNIVGVHEVGVHQGRHYLTMDYIEGSSLWERLRSGSLAPTEAAALLETIAIATHFAHGEGVLHRDLKPANILLDMTGSPHITDFGLAKSLSRFDEPQANGELTRSGQILGTPSYMAPEQANAQHQLVCVGSDVYSLGAILYACLSGRPPFVAETTVETLRQVVHDDPLPPRVLNARVPKDLETICLKCLAKEPRHRYHTAQELADDLRRFLDGRPVLARPVTWVARTWRLAKRRPAAALATGLLLLIAIVSPPIAFQQYWQRQELGVRATRIEHQATEITGLLSVKEDSLRRALSAEQQATTLAVEAKAQAFNFRRLLYISDMQRMSELFAEGNIPAMKELLSRHKPVPSEPDLRDFEWYYWQRQCATHDREWSHENPLKLLCVSHGGEWIASCDVGEHDASIQIRNARSSELLQTLSLANCSVTAMVFRDDDSLLVTGLEGSSFIVRKWSWRDGAISEEELFRSSFVTSQTPPRHAISRSGKFMATAMMGRIRVVDTERFQSLTVRLPPDLDAIHLAELKQLHGVIHSDPQGKYVDFQGFLHGGMRIRNRHYLMELPTAAALGPPVVWNVNDPALPPVERDGGPVFSLAFSADDSLLAAGSREGRLVIWELATGDVQLDVMAHDGIIWDLAFSSDHQQVVSVGDDGGIKVWDIQQRSLSHSLAGHDGAVRCVDFGIDGRIVTGGDDRSVRGWRLPGIDAEFVLRGSDDGLTDILIARDGRSFWTGGRDGRVLQWPMRDELDEVVIEVTVPAVSVDVSNDERFIAAVGLRRGVTVWDRLLGQRRFLETDESRYPGLHRVRVTHDKVWAVHSDGSLVCWSLETGEQESRRQLDIDAVRGYFQVDVAPSGDRVAYRTSGGRVNIASLDPNSADSQPVVRLARSFNRDVLVRFSDDGTRVLTQLTRNDVPTDVISLSVWDATSGELLCDVGRGAVAYSSLSADNEFLAYVEAPDDSSRQVPSHDDIVVYSIAEQREVARFSKRDVRHVALSPNGDRLAMVVANGAPIKDAGGLLSVVEVDGESELSFERMRAHQVEFTSDGSRLLVTAHDGGVLLVDAISGDVTERLIRDVGQITSVEFSADSRQLAATFSNEFAFGQTVLSLETPNLQKSTWMPSNGFAQVNLPVEFASDDSLVYRGIRWRQLRISPEVQLEHGLISSPSDPVHALPEAYAREANALFLVAPDQTLMRFEFVDGPRGNRVSPFDEPITGRSRLGRGGTPIALATPSDGRFLAVAVQGRVLIHDGNSLELLAELDHAMEARNVLTFNHDGTLLATAGEQGDVRIWNTEDWTLAASILTHSKAVTCLRFSPLGRTVFSAGFDGTLCLSDVTTGATKTVFKADHGIVHWIAISDDGSRLATAGDDGTILIRHATSEEER